MSAPEQATFIEPGTVKMERLLPGPAERAWAYLTESDKRAQWLAGGEFDLRVGGKIQLEFDNSRLPNDEEGLKNTRARASTHSPARSRAWSPTACWPPLGCGATGKRK